MKNLKKLLAVLVALTIIAGITIVPTFAAEPLKYENEAKVLNQLKLFEGVSKTEYKPNLEARLLREESVGLLLRMFGLIADAEKLTDKEAADILNAKFKDAGDIAAWAVKYVAYAVKNEIIAGRPDGKFAPKDNVLGREYAKMLLSMLGYKQGTDFQYEFAIVELCNVTDFSKAEAVKLDTIPLLRDDVVGLSFTSLKAEYAAGANKGKSVISVIVGDNKNLTAIATEAGLIEKVVIKSVAAIADLDIKVGDKLELPAKVKVTYSNGTTAEVAVKWPVVDTSKAMEKTEIKGTIEGTEIVAKVNVTIKKVALVVASVKALSNTRLSVALSEEVSAVDPASFVITDKDGKALEVKSATLGADKKSVELVTAAQVAYSAYTLKAGDISKSYVALPVDSTKPTIKSALVKTNTTVEVVFNEPVDKASAENLANYGVDNDLTLLKASLDSAGTKVTLTTSSQVVSKIYKLTIQNVTDLAGNAMAKYENLFGAMAPDTQKPTVTTAVVDGNTTFYLIFSESLDKLTAENIDNYKIDNDLQVIKAVYDGENLKVTLTTSPQVVSKIYKITVQNVADSAGNVMDKFETLFGAMAPDTEKPTVKNAVVKTNTLYEVTFNEKVDKASAENVANYVIDNDLKVEKAVLSSSGDKVTLTTSEQVVSKIYKIVIQNVADIAGNVMNKYDTLFGAMAKDTTPPTVKSVVADTNKVTITYEESVVKANAIDVFNYIFDNNLGYATTATLDSTGTIVTLNVASMTPGTIYSVTINNVIDLSSNVIAANTKKTFVGVGTTASAASLTLQTITTINENTFDLIFDRDLSGADVASITIALKDSDGAAYEAALVPYVGKQADKKVVRVQYNKAKIFENGKIYSATITGPANLVTKDSANVKSFAGTTVTNPVPFLQTAVAVNNRAIKVTFSEPVKGIQAGVFSTDPAIAITGFSVAPTDEVTEALIYLGSDLAVSQIYKLNALTGSVTDAAGFAAWKIANSDATQYYINFAGTNVTNAAPVISVVTPLDKYNFNIVFSEAVANADVAGIYTVVKTSGDGVDLDLTGATYALSSDKTTVTVRLLSTTPALKSGTVYELTYTPGAIADLQGLAYSDASGANKKSFAGIDTANAKPAIAGVEATGTTVRITMSEAITGYTNQTDFFDITIDGAAVTPTAGAISGKVITLTVPAITAGKSGSVKINNTGKAAIKDINGQEPTTDAISFGTK